MKELLDEIACLGCKAYLPYCERHHSVILDNRLDKKQRESLVQQPSSADWILACRSVSVCLPWLSHCKGICMPPAVSYDALFLPYAFG